MSDKWFLIKLHTQLHSGPAAAGYYLSPPKLSSAKIEFVWQVKYKKKMS